MCPKDIKMNLKFYNSLRLTEKNIVSSTNWRGDGLSYVYPPKAFQQTTVLSSQYHPTQHISNNGKKKREAKRGSPCLKPLETLTQPLAHLFTKTEKRANDKHP